MNKYDLYYSIKNNKEMSLLIYSGLLYLIGISIILLLKPELMFTKDGSWKEFGLGHNKSNYTWMPFWLFTIMWAIISYVIVLVVASHTGLGGISNSADISVQSNNDHTIEPENISLKALTSKKRTTRTQPEMEPGYYILDTNETVKRGIPKYIYLGPEVPNLVYHNTASVNTLPTNAETLPTNAEPAPDSNIE